MLNAIFIVKISGVVCKLNCLHWRRRHRIVAMECGCYILSLSSYSIFPPKLRLLLPFGNERNRIESLTQSVEWLQFAVDCFCSVVWSRSKITAFSVLQPPARQSAGRLAGWLTLRQWMTLKHCSEAVCTLPLHADIVNTICKCRQSL